MQRIGLLLIFVVLTLSNHALLAQAIDNTASFRMVDSDRYMKLHYENDYFTATDYYYTQGINFEVVAPSYNKFPLSKLLFTPANGKKQFGIALEHNGYTPTSIKSNDILVGDRPFAAALMLKSFSMTNDSSRRLRITSSLSLGVIGPAAGGYEMQKAIHKWIAAQEPFGWQYQIRNAAIINYEIGVEKNLLASKDFFLINGFADGRLGTLDTKLSTGAVFIFGRLNPRIQSTFSKDKIIKKRKVHFHLYAQPMISLVGYDTSLQGDIFNHDSPYTIAASDISRITFQVNYGAILSFRSVQLDYFKSDITKEFATGQYHRWGGIRVAVNF